MEVYGKISLIAKPRLSFSLTKLSLVGYIIAVYIIINK